MKTKQKTVFVIVIVIVVVSLFIYVKYGYLSSFSNNYKEQIYSQQRWNEYPFERFTMVKDLENNYDLLSMNREEILDLLGTKAVNISETCIRYDTGGGYLGDEILQFIFDESGKVIDIGIAN